MTDGPIQSPHDAPVAFTEQQRATLKGVVDKYAAGELDRAAAVVHLTIALGNICVALKVPFSATVLRPYIEELEGVDNQRGAGDGGSSGGAGGSNNKRRRDDDDEEQAPQKRQRIDYAELLRPALSADEFLDTVVSAKALLVASRVQKFSEDPKEAVRVVVNSPLAPAFPPGLWKLVLLDQYVDFNLIRANTFATEPERASELVIGDGELEVRKPRASSQITSAAQWNDAFWIYSEAVNFAFPGREQELRAYNRHINNTFSSTHDSCHHRVFKHGVSSLTTRAPLIKSGTPISPKLGSTSLETSSGTRDSNKLVKGGPGQSNGRVQWNFAATTTQTAARWRTASIATPASNAKGPIPLASVLTSPPDASERAGTTTRWDSKLHLFVPELLLGEDEESSCFLPQYMRGMGWKGFEPVSYSRTARYTEIDEPLPQPSPYEFSNETAIRTIHANPDLFQVPQVIRADHLENLLGGHPNQPFVQSVLTGLREGFWSWLHTHHNEGYPETWDNSWAPPPSQREKDFITS
ncbi:C3H1-type domain-containing protein [Mycena indigotica]|uniref:C3H1-type domain-containing protein n=1 Tax=Mycena indigotica TaxID=2126181 RepID=A0A8H6TE03_9AGAR|nr:C3H1-type domain-containing protein [Mycena indigotica]KAF7315011.1 C3H1-type domain-containing protein [Mycena indigotica]